ncbi:MAG TPA: toll/interleukin-1 receptor domain-containing protein, partial [Pyrinomonadaceae bacterium]
MAYISSAHFDNDIFLSYARVDDQKDPGQAKGWVELFHEYLEVELSKQIGRMGVIEIWRDRRELSSSSYFDAEIQKQINRSAIFLSLTSNGYLHPQSYCLKELQWFYRKAQTGSPVGLSVDNRSRIFNVLLYNIPSGKWPAEYAGTSGQPFNDAKRPDDTGAPLPPDEELFKDNLRQLVRQLFEMLEAVKRAVEPRPEPQPAPVAEDAFTVYLADTSDSLRAVRKRVINELQQSGVRVVSNIPPPYPARQHEETVTAAVAGAQLSVHLLNDVAGREIDDDPGKSYVQKQVEISLEHAK